MVTKVLGEWGVPLLIRMLLAIPWGICAVMIAVNVGHMASHVPTFHAPTLNRLLGWFSFDVCLGLSWKMWLHEHVVGHHQYTNIITIDPNAPEGHGDEALYRSSPNQRWFTRFTYQYIWLPLISFLLITEYRVASIRYWSKGFRKEIRVNREFLGLEAFVTFFLGKFLWFYRVYYIPIAWWGRPIGETILLVLFSETIAGYFVGTLNAMFIFIYFIFKNKVQLKHRTCITFPANHITDKVDWPTMTKDEKTQEMKIDAEWAVMQIQTCKDYSPESWVFSHVFGALNNHSCHHLFPAMHHSYYAQIYPIVKQTAKEYKVKLPDVAGYLDLVYDYVNNLRVLADEKGGKHKYI
ncbi:hypothetical protein RFI_20745 [Reticulomyxa filosa]|uniref:Fatty acid desaturase domain-containing protein n=1 Tax=Reticulomyxa filosa TaxID=46433 RepID=X6MRY5_RETFI|nr:hypothetical protein RFI_20745 [Reticulomyxa filosa]|eukprot:ETO16594.1 hypothetical protein RFI_20745 [Reticulomyxa filosa]